jgi:uncharacterized membrane protein
MPKINLLDTIAFLWFVMCWGGYTYFADHSKAGSRALMGAMQRHRERWIRELLTRSNRIFDASLLGNIMNSVSFFASTTILIIAGLVTILGTLEQAIEVTADLPFARRTSREGWELKLLLLLAIFGYAFFEFTWALRQYNFFSVLLGSAPNEVKNIEECQTFIAKAARMSGLSGDTFNLGVRSYYFGLAALTWFVQAWMFMVVSALVVAVLYRRDFASKTLRTLQMEDSAPPAA